MALPPLRKELFFAASLNCFIYFAVTNLTKKKNHGQAAGPESLEDYFQKGALLGQKAALNLWNVDTRPNLQKF